MKFPINNVFSRTKYFHFGTLYLSCYFEKVAPVITCQFPWLFNLHDALPRHWKKTKQWILQRTYSLCQVRVVFLFNHDDRREFATTNFGYKVFSMYYEAMNHCLTNNVIDNLYFDKRNPLAIQLF